MTGCYKCGSDEGNEAKLCPACTAERLESRSKINEAPRKDLAIPDLGLSLTSPLVLGVLAGTVILNVVLILIYALYVRMSGGSSMSPEKIVKICTEGVDQAAGETGDGATSAFTAGIMLEVCKSAKTSCTADPDGEICGKAGEMMKIITAGN